MQPDYVPFGPEWEKEMMKWSKPMLIAKLKEVWATPAASTPAPDNDMTVQDFYSGFNLDFMSEEEKQTIYTATELFAKGKVRGAMEEKERIRLLLEGLTPGGSEFYNDPQYCFDHVEEQLRSIPKQILPFKQRADKAEATLSLIRSLAEARSQTLTAIAGDEILKLIDGK